MHGTLEPAGEQWRLRFSRRLAHPLEKVWRAVVEAEHRDSWFPQRIEGEWRTGARLKFVSEYGDFDGEVLAYQPPSLVEFVWGTDVIRLELQPDGNGTLLTLTDTFAEHGKAARDAAGWHVCLDALEAALAGTRQAAQPDGRWKAVHAEYVERLGPEAASIGPPEVPSRKA
ncbi:MAG: SRPBCC family protein [Chloroflexi bacterium]|nr:SRPBCC family protein [Chloroflexota bacterium]